MGGSILEAALEYAGAGHKVLPIWGVRQDGTCHCPDAQCTSPGKHPHGRLVPRGLTDASDDEETIRSWWSQYPLANVGLCTGEQFFVVDCDRHELIDGTALFLQLAEEQGGLPEEVACADTGGGGAHFCFAMQEGATVRNQQAMLVEGTRITGIDVRGEGGYVVAPPSVHASGRRYVWKRGLHEHLGAAPGWLLELVSRPEVVVPAAVPSGPESLIGTHRDSPAERYVEPAEVERIRAALKLMPSNCDRQTWLERVSMPLHDLFGGSDVGFEVWHEWSKTAAGLVTPTGKPAYGGERECRRIWQSFHVEHRNPKGQATFWEHAAECGWRPPEGAGNGWPAPGVSTTVAYSEEELAEALGGPRNPGPFPPSIALDLEGPISELVDWMTEAARRPDRTIALAASLAVVAGAVGRRVVGPEGTRATLALAMLAPSGSGKDKPQECIKNLLDSHPNLCLGLMDDTPTHRTQLDDLLLKNRGQVLMVLDEYGGTLQRWLRSSDLASASMSPTVRRLSTHGMTTYRLAPVSLRHPSRAANVAAWDAGIFAPSFSLIGFTTPGQFYEALSDSSLTDGFLGRHVVIASESTADLRSPRASTVDVPAGVKAWLETVQRVPIPRVGPPTSFRPAVPQGNPMALPDSAPADPWPVDWSHGDAEAAWLSLSREIDRAAHESLASGDETLGAILRRLPGQTMMVALVLACGEARTLAMAEVTERHVRLAYQLCHWSAEHVAWKLRRGVAHDDLSRAYLYACEVVERRAPRPVHRSYFVNRAKTVAHVDKVWRLFGDDPRFMIEGRAVRSRNR